VTDEGRWVRRFCTTGLIMAWAPRPTMVLSGREHFRARSRSIGRSGDGPTFVMHVRVVLVTATHDPVV
jgi:hypothetical protein